MTNMIRMLSCVSVAFAQTPTVIGTQSQVILLWDQGAPGALGDTPADRPFLTFYPPYPAAPAGRASGTAVIIAPGGGYQSLAITHEGAQEANWFNAMGVAAFVLQYRLGPRYHHPIQLG